MRTKPKEIRKSLKPINPPPQYPAVLPTSTIEIPQLGAIYRELLDIKATLKGQPITDEKLNIKKAAMYLDMSESSVRKLIRSGEIKHYRAGGNSEEGGNIRIRRSECDRWVEAQEEKNAASAQS
jgi:excisionase family DNA binding protein